MFRLRKPKNEASHINSEPSFSGREALRDTPLKTESPTTIKPPPSINSATNSPRILARNGPFQGTGPTNSGQLTAAERVRLRQQAAAMGVVERLKHRKLHAPVSSNDRELKMQPHAQARSSDRHTVDHRRQAHTNAATSLSTLSVGVNQAHSEVDTATSLPRLSAEPGDAMNKIDYELSGHMHSVASLDSTKITHAAQPMHRPPLKPSLSRRASSTRSIAELDESDLPLSALATHSRRQTLLAECSQSNQANINLRENSPMQSQLDQTVQYSVDDQQTCALQQPPTITSSIYTQNLDGEPNASDGTAKQQRNSRLDPQREQFLTEATSQQFHSHSGQLAHINSMLQEEHMSQNDQAQDLHAILPVQENVQLSLPTIISGPLQQGEMIGAQSEDSNLVSAAVELPMLTENRSTMFRPGIQPESSQSTDPSSSRGILEKLATLKGLQKSSRPSSRVTSQHGWSEAVESQPRGQPANIVSTQPSTAWGRLHPSQDGKLCRKDSVPRIQSLRNERNRHRSRLSVDGQLENGSPGRAHLVHMNTFPSTRTSESGASPDMLSLFEHSAQFVRNSSAAHGHSDAQVQRLRSAASFASPFSSNPGSPMAATPTAGAVGEPWMSSTSTLSAPFSIPTSPSGQVLQVCIQSTWGDMHYVGLAALEFFDASGEPVTLSDPMSKVTADPESINVLPEYGNDPRTPDKLVDGVCMTCDDRHVWLAPYTPGSLHTITVTFDSVISLGMLRIWNYNKNRIHSLRGARHVDVTLDGCLIFSGELQQAPGNVAEAYQHAEHILFTDSPQALARIEQHDTKYLAEAGQKASPDALASSSTSTPGAPAACELDLVTGASSPRGSLVEHSQPGLEKGGHATGMVTGGRPVTAANMATVLLKADCRWSGVDAGPSKWCCPAGVEAMLRCKELTLVFLDTYGDTHFCGLTGLEVIGAGGQPLQLGPGSLWADPPDLNVFPGNENAGDVRTLDKLLDAHNNTMDDTHMWLAPIKRQIAGRVKPRPLKTNILALPETLKQFNILSITLSVERIPVCGLRVWNYNKSPGDTARGVKRCLVLADGVEVSPPGGILLRKAPGTAAIPFGQVISLGTAWAQQQASRQGSPESLLAASHRTTLQDSGRHSPQLRVRPIQGASEPCGELQWDETTAWVTNMPDPLAAAEYLQRCASWWRSNTLDQAAESFSTPLPCGFALKLVILTTWGDPHYVGLCGVEVHDAARGLLHTDELQLLAVPSSVAMLPGMERDVRTPDKLIDGNYEGSAIHSWLAPLSPDEGNCIFITYDEPLLLGAIRVWNYAKNPSRGVQEMEVYLDDQLVYKGVLQRAPEAVQPGQDFSQTLCFSEEAVQAEMRARVARSRVGEGAHDSVADWLHQDCVVLVNDGQFVKTAGSSGQGATAPPPVRPITAAVP